MKQTSTPIPPTLPLLALVPPQPPVLRDIYLLPLHHGRPKGDLPLVGHDLEVDAQHADVAVAADAGRAQV